MKAFLFDLDDTLYPEIDFVKSGFKAVAAFLKNYTDVTEKELFEKQLFYLYQNGRGKIFNCLLKEYGLNEQIVPFLVYIYRCHKPNIKLYQGVFGVLKKLKEMNYFTGIITDGMASIQRRKIEALNLINHVDIIICTDELGRDYWKPSTIPFKLALELLNATANNSYYIGNDITKDFIGAKQIGMQTIQINHPNNSLPDLQDVSEDHRAIYSINKFSEIFKIVS